MADLAEFKAVRPLEQHEVWIVRCPAKGKLKFKAGIVTAEQALAAYGKTYGCQIEQEPNGTWAMLVPQGDRLVRHQVTVTDKNGKSALEVASEGGDADDTGSSSQLPEQGGGSVAVDSDPTGTEEVRSSSGG